MCFEQFRDDLSVLLAVLLSSSLSIISLSSKRRDLFVVFGDDVSLRKDGRFWALWF